jgi:hypothetical protein
MAKKAVVVEKGIALIQSKTFWFNILTLAIAVASLFGFGDFEPNAKVAEIASMIGGIGNILLRLNTSKPITRIK